MSKLSDKLYTLLKEFHTLDTRKDGLSVQLMRLAQGKSAKEFDTACTQAEGQYKADTGEKKVPRGWTNPKSNIKKALELKMDLSKYDTESALRKALTEKRKGTTGSTASSGESTNIRPMDTSKAEYEDINKSLAAIHNVLHKLDDVEETIRSEVVARIDEVLANAVGEMTDILDEFTDIVGGEVEKVENETKTKTA